MSQQEFELQNSPSMNQLEPLEGEQFRYRESLCTRIKNSHLFLLLLKNYLVYRRQLTMTIFLLLSPIVMCILIVMFQAIVNQISDFLIIDSEVRPLINSVPHCRGDGCTSIGYFVLGEEEHWINKTMNKVSESESLTFGKDVRLLGVFSEASSITSYLKAHMNKTQIAIVFCTDKWEVSSSISVPCTFDRLAPEQMVFYTILYNYTLLYKSPYLSDMRAAYPKDDIATRLKVSLDNAIISVFSLDQSHPHMNVYTQDYPRIPNRFVTGIDVVGNYGAFYFFAPYLLGFLLTVNELLTEKGRRLRQGLVVMGLSHMTYWLSWTITALIKVTALTVILIITGCIFQFDLFLQTPVPITFLLFATFGFSIQLLAFFIATVCPDVKNGYTIAYGFILIAIVMQMFFTQSAMTIIFVQ